MLHEKRKWSGWPVLAAILVATSSATVHAGATAPDDASPTQEQLEAEAAVIPCPSLPGAEAIQRLVSDSSGTLRVQCTYDLGIDLVVEIDTDRALDAPNSISGQAVVDHNMLEQARWTGAPRYADGWPLDPTRSRTMCSEPVRCRAGDSTRRFGCSPATSRRGTTSVPRHGHSRSLARPGAPRRIAPMNLSRWCDNGIAP